MPAPRISVLMSVYNGQAFLRQAVDSVLKQTLGDFEFIIFDDKSTDSSAEILRSYGDPRIRFIPNEENAGLTKNLVRGMEMAAGEYVARMDADDVCLPERFARQVEYLDQHRDISVLGSAVWFFDDSGREILGTQPESHDEIKCMLLYNYTMLHPSVMMRKADLAEHGLTYNPHFIYSQDFDLWTRSIRKVRFANLRQPLLRMREHNLKITRTKRPKQKALSDEVRRRQLDELGVRYSAGELRVFHLVASGERMETPEDLPQYDSILPKIFEANRERRIFDPAILASMGARCFRFACWNELHQNSHAGRYYWRSRLRGFDADFRWVHKAHLAWDSLFCGWRRKRA